MLHGRNRPFPRSRGAPGNQPTQAETTSWQAAVVTNAGTVSAGRFQIVNNFIAAEKAAGTWALTDDYWGLWAENVPQALTSLKQLRLAVSVSAPNFTTDRGYLFDGAVNYLNTGFIPSTHGVAMTATNVRAAVYERTFANGGVSTGATTSATSVVYIGAHTTGNLVARPNISSGLTYALPGGTSVGYAASSRNGSTNAECFGYKNGIALVQVGTATMGLTLPTHSMFIGAQNNAGAPASFRAASIGFACTGAALTAAQEQGQYTNVQLWAAAIGAQV